MPTPHNDATRLATAQDVTDGVACCALPVEPGEPLTTVSDYPWHADCAWREALALVAV